MAASSSTGMTTEITRAAAAAPSPVGEGRGEGTRLAPRSSVGRVHRSGGLVGAPHGGAASRSTEGADRAAGLLADQPGDLLHHAAQREDVARDQHGLIGATRV